MAYPTPLEILLPFIVLLVGGSITYLVARALKLRPPSIAISDPERQMRFVVLLIAVLFAVIIVYRLFVRSRFAPWEAADLGPAVARALILLLPLALVMRLSRQSLETIGIGRRDLGKLLVLGLALSLALFLARGCWPRPWARSLRDSPLP